MVGGKHTIVQPEDEYQVEVQTTGLLNTHLQETLDLIDYSMIPFDHDKLMALGRDVFNTRSLHHHTFNEENFAELLKVAGFHPSGVHFEWPHQLIAVARAR